MVRRFKTPAPELVAEFAARVRRNSRVDEVTGCRVWLGSVNGKGYGRLRQTHGTFFYAHRMAYLAERGPIPPGMVLDHLCRNPPCCNPDHLEVVTERENQLRGETFGAVNSRRTHCKVGHLLEFERIQESGHPRRFCRTCVNARKRAARARRKTARSVGLRVKGSEHEAV